MEPNQQLPPSEPQVPPQPIAAEPVAPVTPVTPAGPVTPVVPVAPVQPVMQPPATNILPQQPQPEVSQPAQATPPNPTEQSFQWTAPEYLSSARSTMWYVLFWGGVVVFMAIAAFLIKSITFAVLIPIMAAALTIYTHRPARMMQYVVSPKGLYINDQIHALAEFRGFGVQQGEAMPSLLFIPTKRFRPSITVYFPQELGEQLVDFIGVRLPIQETKLDAFDKVVRRLHL